MHEAELLTILLEHLGSRLMTETLLGLSNAHVQSMVPIRNVCQTVKEVSFTLWRRYFIAEMEDVIIPSHQPIPGGVRAWNWKLLSYPPMTRGSGSPATWLHYTNYTFPVQPVPDEVRHKSGNVHPMLDLDPTDVKRMLVYKHSCPAKVSPHLIFCGSTYTRNWNSVNLIRAINLRKMLTFSQQHCYKFSLAGHTKQGENLFSLRMAHKTTTNGPVSA